MSIYMSIYIHIRHEAMNMNINMNTVYGLFVKEKIRH